MRCSILHITQLGFNGRIIWVPQDPDDFCLRDHFVQKSQPLRFQPRCELVDASYIAARPAKARYNSGFDGIRAEGEDDRDRLRRALRRQCSLRARGHNDRYLPVDQIGRESWKSIKLPLGKAIFERQILPLNEPAMTQPPRCRAAIRTRAGSLDHLVGASG